MQGCLGNVITIIVTVVIIFINIITIIIVSVTILIIITILISIKSLVEGETRRDGDLGSVEGCRRSAP